MSYRQEIVGGYFLLALPVLYYADSMRNIIKFCMVIKCEENFYTVDHEC